MTVRQQRRLFLVSAVLVGGLVFLIIFNLHLTEHETLNFYRQQNDVEKFVINTKGCTIPAMQPLDSTIKKFVEFPNTMKPCRNETISLLSNNKTNIWIVKENIQYYNISITNGTSITCCYRSFYRPTSIEDVTSSRIDDRIEYKECINFSETIEVQDEFVRVNCSYETVNLYEQFYLFALEKKFHSDYDNTGNLTNKTAYNVIIMGIDAVSRLNFYRTMPNTIAYLKKQGAIDFLGYNKVGDNTFPNLMPLLLGTKETELRRKCVPTHKSTFDNCPFIWGWFKQAGYYTALGEDTSRLGTFNYAKVGFSKTPTDYYIHTFMHDAEKYAGYNKDFNSYLCMNDKFLFRVLLDYIEDLTSILKSSKLFGFFWEVTMSHDYLNYPMVMDDAYEQFLNRLHDSNYLNHTIIILMSDHGIRWGNIRSTKQGRLEERLPFVFLLTPPIFRTKFKKAYNNLILNSRRLTTPFDLHSTLLDLVDLDNIIDDNISTRSNQHYADDRGISLFLPIPTNRTCKMAAIDDHWCTCHRRKKLSEKDKKAREVAEQLVFHLNTVVSAHEECAQFMLGETIEATEIITNKLDEEKQWREFTVMIRTTPGDGVFDGTLQHDGSDWTVLGTVSRLNLYGEQSLCVDDALLKLYCYCHSNGTSLKP